MVDSAPEWGEIERQARLFRQTEEVAHIGGWEFDLHKNTLFWSDETHRIHDTTPESYRPDVASAIEFYTLESRPVIQAAVERAIECGTPYDLELGLITAKGRPIWVRSTGSVEREDGRTVRICGALQDITERIEAREKLRESEARLADVVATALDAIVVLEGNGRIALFNRAAETMFGVRAGEAIGEPAMRFLPAWGSGEGLDERRRGVARRGNGEPFECEAAISRAIHAGRPLYTVILRDLTETGQAEEARAHLELQLRQAQKMEAIGTLAGGIAHDFNNILGAVLGNAEMALSTITAEHAARPFVQQILRSADRASNLVRQILAFSRPHDQQRRPLRLDGVIGEAVQLLRSTLPTSIVITTDVESAAPTVLADVGQVQQVLMNLCTNAGHAIGERPGRLRIALRSVDLDAAAAAAIPELGAGRYVVLSVSDDGIGMDRETLQRIFEPFFTTKEPGVGTGLGLSVAHGIMRAHEGGIRVETERGRGTTFHLYFPASQAAPAEEVDEVEAPPPRGRGERVVLIDDEIALVTVGRMVLERYGYAVTTFTDPVAALAALTHAAADVHLVITDLTMPGIGGLELAREVQRLRPGLPVLLMTGYTGKLDSVTLGQDGVVGVIQKPFTAMALGQAVHAAVAAPVES